MAFKNRIRLPITLGRAQFPTDRNVFRKANGERKVLSVTISKTLEGVTDELPEDWHQKLNVALNHDIVNIEDTRLITGVTMDGDYQVAWSDFKNYPVAPAAFTVNVTPFDASNNNCQTCSDISQLSLQDDVIEEVWEEGQSYENSDILSNDAICCFPATVQLRSFNSFFFSSVILSPDGKLSVTLNDGIPDANNVLVCTYRVTCPDGSFDEANVYIESVQGSGTVCETPENLMLDTLSQSSLGFIWSGSSAQYGWEIARAATPNVVIISGVVNTSHVNVVGLMPSTEYVIRVWSICGVYSISDEVSANGTTTAATRHRNEDNYTYVPTSPITGICTVFNTSVVRTTEAAEDSISTNQKVRATITYTSDGISPSEDVDYTFNVGSTIANETTGVSFASYCGEITGVCTNVVVIP